MKKLLILFLFYSCFCVACEDDPVCESEEMRCDETVVQICDGAGHWADIMDCSEVGEGFSCQYVESEDVFSCIPVEGGD